MKIALRKELALGDWDRFAERHRFASFFHTERWIDYALAYDDGARDLSYAVIDNGAIGGIVPWVAPKGDEFKPPVFGGRASASPLLSKGTVVQFVPYDYELLPTEPGVRPYLGIAHGVPVHDVSIASIRKSYRPLVDGSAHVESFCSRAEAIGLIDEARGLHIKSAGRETRPAATWDLQARWLTEGCALIAFDGRAGAMRAFAYFLIYGRRAYYASSAGERMHALIWTAIDYLRKRGIETLWMDWSYREPRDEKERGIAFFKRGFGGYDVRFGHGFNQ